MASGVECTRWYARKVSEVTFDGCQLSSTNSPGDQSADWLPATVPGTVLSTLVANGAYGHPYTGLNNDAIPDIGVVGRDCYTYWFCTAFKMDLPEDNETAWLHLRGVNYSFRVFCNGREIESRLPGEDVAKGMFLRRTLDITAHLAENSNAGSIHHLAVVVYPPDNPGVIPAAGGQGGDHMIAQDVTAQYVEGWDWVIPTRDRNTGLWDRVSVHKTGPVALRHAHVTTTRVVPSDNSCRRCGREASATCGHSADLDVSVDLVNASSADVAGELSYTVTPHMDPTTNGRLDGIFESDMVALEDVTLSMPVHVPAGDTVRASFETYAWSHPSLWWPNGHGQQCRYDVAVAFTPDQPLSVRNATPSPSDVLAVTIGVREIVSGVDSVTGGRQFTVNGAKVFIRGGNWICDDAMLATTPDRYDSAVRLNANMNLNMLRVWGGSIAERPEFYTACDRYGVLVWQEFWITGDCNGRGGGDSNFPLSHPLFLASARDTVRMLRNHASLALWVGGNEQRPCQELNIALEDDIIPSLDGTRAYVQGSVWGGFCDGQGGKGYLHLGDGPYGIQNPRDFFKDTFYEFGFNPEIGSVGVPVAETMRAFLPPGQHEPPTLSVQPGAGSYVLQTPNAAWTFHKYIGYGSPETGICDQICLYGLPKGLDEYCEQAQLANYIQYRALFEGWNSFMWTRFTGVLLWKLQNPWTGLRGQLYDWYHEQNGGFFGARSACEPLHIQFNPTDSTAEIVNATRHETQELVATWTTYTTLDGKAVQACEEKVSVPAYSTIKWKAVTPPVTHEGVWFLLLTLKQADGRPVQHFMRRPVSTDGEPDSQIVSRNFYWLPKDLETQTQSEFLPLRRWRDDGEKVVLRVSGRTGTGYESKGPDSTIRVDGVRTGLGIDGVRAMSNRRRVCVPLVYENNCDAHGFFVRLRVLDEAGMRILPVQYSDNYFTIPSRTSLNVNVVFDLVVDRDRNISIISTGWNCIERVCGVFFPGPCSSS